MITYLTFIALALAGPCKKHLMQVSIEESLHTKLQVSPKSKKLNLPIEFSNKVVQLLRNTDWESTPIPTTIKRVATKCLHEIGRTEVINDANPFALLVQVIQKWHEENWKESDQGTPKWERFGGQGQTSALTYKILNEYEFSQWLKKRGDFARYDHVAAYVSLDLINRTQNSISDEVTNLNGQKIPFGTLVDMMRRHGFDPIGAPDLVPVSNGRFATFDHRRLVAAKLARIPKVLAKIHRPEANVPSEIFSKSMSVKVKTQQPLSIPDFRRGGFHTVEFGYRPRNWGEAVYCACANTRYKDSPNFPFEGAAGLPTPPQSYFYR